MVDLDWTASHDVLEEFAEFRNQNVDDSMSTGSARTESLFRRVLRCISMPTRTAGARRASHDVLPDK